MVAIESRHTETASHHRRARARLSRTVRRSLLGIFVAGFSLAAAAATEENVPWELEVDGGVDRPGIVWIRINGVNFPVALRLTDDTEEKKAAAYVAALRNNRDFNRCYRITDYDGADDDDFKIELIPSSDCGDSIKGITINNGGTGEDSEAVKDDPPATGEIIRTAYFTLVGEGIAADGLAKFQIGDENPMITVETFGRSGPDILDELMASFNETYRELGFQATRVPYCPGIAVEKVPCPLGVRAGTTDTGLISEMGLVLPPAAAAGGTGIPTWSVAVAAAAILVLALLLFSALRRTGP